MIPPPGNHTLSNPLLCECGRYPWLACTSNQWNTAKVMEWHFCDYITWVVISTLLADFLCLPPLLICFMSEKPMWSETVHGLLANTSEEVRSSVNSPETTDFCQQCEGAWNQILPQLGFQMRPHPQQMTLWSLWKTVKFSEAENSPTQAHFPDLQKWWNNRGVFF